MKKKVLGLAFVAMSLFAFTSMAQTPAQSDQTCKVNKENVKCKNNEKRAGDKKVNPFEGINLSESQKSQLQQLDSKRKADREQKAQARKENKQRNDSSRMTARRADKKSYLEEVKAIIGPEQYVVFLENMYVNGGGRQGGKAFMKQDKNRKGNLAANRHGKSRGNNKSSNKATAEKSAS